MNNRIVYEPVYFHIGIVAAVMVAKGIMDFGFIGDAFVLTALDLLMAK